MNIFNLMESYRSEQIAMLKSLLSDVAKSILDLTESIPKEILLENFKNNANRRYVDFWAKSKDEKEIMVMQFSDGTEIGEFQFDTTAVDKLNKFLAETYSGISLEGTFSCDLYEKCIEFPFYFYGGELTEEDVYFYPNSGMLRIEKSGWDKINVSGFHIFNDDISMWLGREFDKNSWEDISHYGFLYGATLYSSEHVEEGITHISIQLDKIL